MKKLLAISMLLIYTLGTTGVAVASHFCCGRLAAVHIEYALSSSPNQASGQGMQGCCGDMTHFYKVQDAQQAAVNDISLNAPLVQTPLISFTFERLLAILQPSGIVSFNTLHAPPLLTDATPLYIQLSVFRI